MSWYPCELHCHTVHSDGSFQVSELQNAAKDDGLSLIALTDHNTVSGWDELNDSIAPAIRGIEWTTYFGHMLVLGCKKFVDWREVKPYNIDDKIKEIKAHGGLVGVAHPYQIGSPVCTGGRWEFEVRDWSQVDYMEILHDNLRSFSYENDMAHIFWTSLLDKGYKLAATYGRDWHSISPYGHYGCTYLDIDGNVCEEAALDAIKNGRSVVSGGFGFFMSVLSGEKQYRLGDTVPEGEATLIFETDFNLRREKLHDERIKYNTIKIITNGGETALEIPCNETKAQITLEKGKWYRAELWGEIDSVKKHMAITSPIYCKY